MAQDLTGLNSLRQALTPYEDVKFELNLNRHPKAHKNKSIVYAENMKLSKDGSVLENEENIEINQLINDTLNNYYNKNNYQIINIIPCNTELVLFVKKITSTVFDIWRYREQTNKYNEECALFYNKGIVYNYGEFSGTFTYTSNDSLIIAFCEYPKYDSQTFMSPMMTINLGTFTKGTINNKIWNSSVGEFNDRELETYKLPICPEVSLPQIINISNVKGNSYIGTYYVYIRYKINKYDYTQWFNIGYPIINEYKQDTILHQKVTRNDKDKNDGDIEKLLLTYKTNRIGKLSTYVNQNVDLINNCLNVEINHIDTLYDYCQIGFICVSKTYTKYYISSDIKLTNIISISTNINDLTEEIFNTNIYENYYNVKNIINKDNKLYISNYKTTNDKDINTDNISLTIQQQQLIKNNYENVINNEYININNLNFSSNIILKTNIDYIKYPNKAKEEYKEYCKFISLPYYLKYCGFENWVTKKVTIITDTDGDYDSNFYDVDIEDLYIAVKKITINKDVIASKPNEDMIYTSISIGLFHSSDKYWSIRKNYSYNSNISYEYFDFYTQDIKMISDKERYLNAFLTKETEDIYPEIILKSKIYYYNTLDNLINNNIITGLCQGEVYDFYIHFIDKYGHISDGYKLKNKDTRFKYDFNGDGNPLDVCFITIDGNTFIVPSENKLFFKDENNNIGSTIRPSIIKKLNDNKINNSNNIITDNFIDTSFSPTPIVTHIINNTAGLKYLPENVLLELIFGDIFDEEPILYNNAIRFIPYYNSQNELFFKVPKLTSTEGDIQLGLKVEIGDITDYGNYVSYFISHKKLEKTYVLNGFGTKHQLDNILLNDKFESGNIVKLYDIKFEKDWDSDLYDKCTLQENIIQKNGFICYTNLLNKLAYTQDSQLNRTDRQTTLYLSDNTIDYVGVPMTDDEEKGKYGVKYLKLMNINKNKYINKNKKLYRLGNIEYTNCIINKGLNGKYDKHLAIKYGNEVNGVNNILSDTGIGTYGDVFLYEIYGFFDYNNLGLYLSEKSKSHIIYKGSELLGTDIFYEVITTLNLFNYKINNIYDTWIDFYNVFNKDDDYLKEFNRTIYRSAVISDEGRSNNWRYFENDAYKNIEENKGNITNLLAIGNYLYVHTEHSLFAFSEDNTLSMNNQNLQVATPDIFDTEYKEVFITKLGYGGLQDKDAWVAGQFGYIWFDGDTKKIYKVYGNSMDIISNDIQEWLENYNINYIRFANDIKNNRILINISIDYDNNEKNFTLSYNILSKTFISFHSYGFIKSYNTKNELYFLNNIYIHQFIEDNYGKNLKMEKQYKLYFITNSYYATIKYLEYIKYNLRKRDNKTHNKMSIFTISDDFTNFPVEQSLSPYAGRKIRVYNDLVDTDWISCTGINANGGTYPDNTIDKFDKPYWDLGNWHFNYLRNVNNPNNLPESRLFGNYFVIAFDFGAVNTLIEFENLDVQLTKDKNL